jgi:hypothetical protein
LVQHSCLVDELLKKVMSEEGKFKKISIFICTNEELIRALKKKQS